LTIYPKLGITGSDPFVASVNENVVPSVM
jgi:hypothetical protein